MTELYLSEIWAKKYWHIQLGTQQIYSPKMSSVDMNRVQYISGTFLYYALEVEPTMLPALNKISTFQYAPTQHKM